jgi:hypothetical protein
MTVHIRQQIREAAASALAGIATVVEASRVYPLQHEDLPAVLIAVPGETVQTRTMGRPRTQLRAMQLVVELYVRANADVDNAIDGLAKTIEERLFADPTLNALAHAGLSLEGTTTEITGMGDKPIGVARLTFTASALVREGAPHTRI